MPKTQKLLHRQTAKAEAELAQIQDVIAAAQRQLSDLQDAIKAAQREHDKKISALKISLRKKLRDTQRDYDARLENLQSRTILLDKEFGELTAQKGVLAYEIEEQRRLLGQLQTEYRTTRDENTERLSKLRESIDQAKETLHATKEKLVDTNNKLEDATAKLTHIEERLVQAEQAYDARSTDLQTKIRNAEDTLGKTVRMIQEYEGSMESVRKDDEARGRELTQRETALAAGKRALSKERLDFDAEKRRFYQTKAL